LLAIDAGGNLTQAPAMPETAVMVTWRLSVQHCVNQGRSAELATKPSKISDSAIDCT
jgi:hypothetical protein